MARHCLTLPLGLSPLDDRDAAGRRDTFTSPDGVGLVDRDIGLI